MAELRTEEEQVEALKSWWKENGKSLMLGVAVAVAGAMGWKAWNQYQDGYAGNASAIYENIVNPIAMGSSLDDAAVASLNHLGEQLRSDYSSSAYAPMGAMVLARLAAERGDLEQAQSQLDYVIGSSSASEDLIALANLRKAKVLLAKGDAEGAMSAAANSEGSVYTVLYYDVIGDVAAAQGRNADARAAYSSAMDGADAQRRTIIKLKFDDLATGDRS